MKKQTIATIRALSIVLMLLACAGTSEISEQPATPAFKYYELDGLYLTTDEKQMNGVAMDHVKLRVGEFVVVYARGMSTVDTGAQWFKLPSHVAVTWKADSELQVAPASGHTVTVRVVKPIAVTSYVTAVTTAKNGKKIEAIFTVEGKK